jgi:WD40 repeat protein/predicted Ser/Thr protein kinase
LHLFEVDLFYRIKAKEPAPIAERYFAIADFSLTHEQQMTLIAQEVEWRRTLTQDTALSDDPTLPPPPQEDIPEFDFDNLPTLGKGGMGVVYRVNDSALNRDVAIKLLRKDRFPRGVARFINEAQILAQLEHPGVVPIHSIGWHRDGRPFFRMKIVHGETLGDLLDKRTSLAEDLTRYVQIFEQICQTVAFAHSKGILHRDLKPANVMVGAFGEVQVMDWGLGKLLQADGPSSEFTESGARRDYVESAPGMVFGTYPYVAPEQAQGRIDEISQRSDVFGLGGILCEILTGHPTYREPNIRRKAESADLADTWERFGQCGAETELVEIARGCLEREPHKRFANANEVAQRIAEYRAGVQLRLEETRVETEKAHARLAAEEKALQAEKRRTRVARWAMSLGLALAIVSIASFAINYYTSQQTEIAVGRAARLAFGQALADCEQGDVKRGLFWFVRSLELAPNDRELQSSVRHQLAFWQSHLPTLKKTWKEPSDVKRGAFSPDGRSLYVMRADRALVCYDVTSGKVRWQTAMRDDVPRWFLAPSGDSLLAVLPDNMLQWLNAHTGAVLRNHPASGTVLAVAFDPKQVPPMLAFRKAGKVIISNWDGTYELPSQDEPIAASFDRQRNHLLVRSEKSITCWHLPAKKVKVRLPDLAKLKGALDQAKKQTLNIPSLQEYVAQVTDAAISPDGKWLLAACGDHKVRIWNCDNGLPVFAADDPVNIHPNVTKVQYDTAGNRFLSASHESLRLWKADGTLIGSLPIRRNVDDLFGFMETENEAGITAIVAHGGDVAFRRGHVSTGGSDWSSIPFPALPTAVQPAGNLVLLAEDHGQCSLWDIGTLAGPRWIITPFPCHSADFTADGACLRLQFQQRDGKFMEQIWDLHANVKFGDAKPFDGPAAKEEALATSIDQRWRVTGDRGGFLEFADLALGKRLGPKVRCGTAIKSVRFHPDAAKLQVLIVSGDRKVGLFYMPMPTSEDAKKIRRRLEVATGMEMDDAGNLKNLPPNEWAKKQPLVQVQTK